MEKKTKTWILISLIVAFIGGVIGGVIGANMFGATIIQNPSEQECKSEWNLLTTPDATGNYFSSNSGGTNYQEAKSYAQYYGDDDFCFITSCFFDTKQVYYQCYTNTKP